MEEETTTMIDSTIIDDTSSSVPEEQKLSVELDDLIEQLEFMSKELRRVFTNVKSIKKSYSRVLKNMKKKKNRNTDPNRVKREPSGFVSPIPISDELADFLDEPRGSSFPRTVVTKRIIAFIKENNLGDTTNGRMFDLSDTLNPNVMKLRTLLNVDDDTQVGYFSLQTHLKHHFKKNNTVKSEEEDEETSSSSPTVTFVEELPRPVVVKKKRRVKK